MICATVSIWRTSSVTLMRLGACLRAFNKTKSFFNEHDMIFEKIDLESDIGIDAILTFARRGPDAGRFVNVQVKGGKAHKRATYIDEFYSKHRGMASLRSTDWRLWKGLLADTRAPHRGPGCPTEDRMAQREAHICHRPRPSDEDYRNIHRALGILNELGYYIKAATSVRKMPLTCGHPQRIEPAWPPNRLLRNESRTPDIARFFILIT